MGLLLVLSLGGCAQATPAPPTATPQPTATSTSLPPLSGSGGGRIAFATNRDGNYEIYVMNADGTDQRRLTYNPYEDRDPVWSPDGTQIAFSNYEAGHTDIYVINADGSNLRRLTTKGGGAPAWSRDGARIAFSRNEPATDLYVMNADGTGAQQLTDTGTDRAVFSPDWSPDETHMVCVVDANPVRALEEVSTIHVLNLDELPPGRSAELADLRPLPRVGERVNDGPVWSPDGSWIAFSTEVEGRRDIYLMHADGTGLTLVTNTEDINGFHPNWSPDGTQLVFQSSPFGHWDIYITNADGSDPRRLTTEGANDTDPDWAP
ncbi:MAG: PD40 domain-containing protein [Anaerolineales bacterium]|nr:MAG: PD40 domain-containing protein [Anaerolineales bacterium]